MSITGIPTDNNDNIVTVTPTGMYSVDGKGGTDLLVVDYGALNFDVDVISTSYGWYAITDAFFNKVDFYSFERFDFTTGSGADSLLGFGGDDVFHAGAGADVINGGLGADVIDGGAGLDRAILGYTSGVTGNVSVTVDPNATVTIAATGATLMGIENLTINTAAGSDMIDTRLGRGDDNVSTGDGDDTFMARLGHDSFNGGGGIDRLVVDYSAATTAVGHSLPSYGWVTIADKGGHASVDYYGVESFDLTGGSAGDSLIGGALSDRLVGGAGDDLLNGGAGADEIAGGAGVDTWQVDYHTTTALNKVNLNTQTANTGATLSGIEAIHYTGNANVDKVTANAGVYDDWFSTGDGNDLVVTGRGIDVANGGTGDKDVLKMDWSGISDPLQGIQHSGPSYGWYRFESTSGDKLDYYGFEKFTLTGGAGADNLVGGADVDVLRGGLGDDTLNGNAGKDVIDGGGGTDLWIGDLSTMTKAALFNAKASQTKAQVTKMGLDVQHVESVNLKTGVGDDKISTHGYALDDVVDTGNGDDRVDLGLGYDTANGNLGTDILVANYKGFASDISTVGIGYGWNRYGDAADTSHVDYIGFERFIVSGGSGDDVLAGGVLNDRLIGWAGDDVLDGVAGKDLIDGKAGNDTWHADYSALATALDFTLDGTGAGKLFGVGTRVKSIENVQLTTGKVNDHVDLSAGTGNDIVNTGEGDDVVDVGRGLNDVANGGVGNDVLTADASMATSGVRMATAGYGWMTVEARDGSYNLDFINFERVNITGSNFNDRLYGFGQDDTLIGGNGHDILDGNGGNDILTGGAKLDQFVFNDLFNDGVDLITDATSGELLRLSGVTLTGNIAAGDGTGLAQGDIAVDSAGGVTTLHVGVDTTAGADFAVQLTGVFGTGDFSASGGDILLL